MNAGKYIVTNISPREQYQKRGIVQTWAVADRDDPSPAGIISTHTTRQEARDEAKTRNRNLRTQDR